VSKASDPASGTAPARSERTAGLLLHLTCLPGAGPIGDLGPAAHALLDWLVDAGLAWWQILPVGPTGFGDSPYGSLSSFAGSPLFVSSERLAAAGLCDPGVPRPVGAAEAARSAVDFAAARAQKQKLHREVWSAFSHRAPGEQLRRWEAFRQDPSNAWVADWAEYAALKERHDGRPWLDWDPELRDRTPSAMARARRELADEIEFQVFEQFLFAAQWSDLRAAAVERGVRLIGDLPIYPALDSADVWAHRDLFRLGRSGRPTRVAGVPPDYFSASGQLWGNPLYRWRRHAARGFDWWISRLRRQLELFDLVRLDHFRGFVAFWSIGARAETAERGRWVPGPGRAFFDALRPALGELPLVAEDLGEIDEPVHELRRELGLPGMRVLQFGFDVEDSLHAPHRHPVDCVAYSGTHDNDTSRGWLATAADEPKRRALLYLGADETTFAWAMARATLTSPADLAILPIQDLLGLGAEARLNTPGRDASNWTWRLRADQVPDGLAQRVRELAGAAARRPPLPSSTKPVRPAPPADSEPD